MKDCVLVESRVAYDYELSSVCMFWKSSHIFVCILSLDFTDIVLNIDIENGWSSIDSF